MAVEIAVVMPVILVVLVIVVDMLIFAGECARFDHVAPQRILASTTTVGDSGLSADDQSSVIQSALEEEFARNGSSVHVSCEEAGQLLSSMVVYTCEFRFAPWPLTLPGSPAFLTHRCTLAVDPYTPGALL